MTNELERKRHGVGEKTTEQMNIDNALIRNQSKMSFADTVLCLLAIDVVIRNDFKWDNKQANTKKMLQIY